MDYVKTLVAGADLPNAVHIDRVIVSAQAKPHRWKELWDASGKGKHIVALKATLDAICSRERLKAWHLVRMDAVEKNLPTESWDAIIALIAYDDCAYMLDSDPGELAILAAFGDPRAVLLLPACKVFHSCKEEVV